MSRLREMRTPVFWAEGHPGTLPREDWEIHVQGLCETPGRFGWHDIVALPKTVVYSRLTSVTRFSVGGRWGGVTVADVLAAVKALPAVRYVRFWSVRRVYDTSIPVEVARMEKTLLAYEFDGQPLEEDYGGPIRALVPYLWGYKSAKSVVGVELMDRYVPGYWEKRGYTDEARIEAGLVRDMNEGGRLRPIPAGEVTHFLDE